MIQKPFEMTSGTIILYLDLIKAFVLNVIFPSMPIALLYVLQMQSYNWMCLK